LKNQRKVVSILKAMISPCPYQFSVQVYQIFSLDSGNDKETRRSKKNDLGEDVGEDKVVMNSKRR